MGRFLMGKATASFRGRSPLWDCGGPPPLWGRTPFPNPDAARHSDIPPRAAKPSLVSQRPARNPAHASFRGRSPLLDCWDSSQLWGPDAPFQIRVPIALRASPQSGKKLPQSKSASREIPPPFHFAGAARFWTAVVLHRFGGGRRFQIRMPLNIPSSPPRAAKNCRSPKALRAITDRKPPLNCVLKHELPRRTENQARVRKALNV